jgi:hypothetical protein
LTFHDKGDYPPFAGGLQSDCQAGCLTSYRLLTRAVL